MEIVFSHVNFPKNDSFSCILESSSSGLGLVPLTRAMAVDWTHVWRPGTNDPHSSQSLSQTRLRLLVGLLSWDTFVFSSLVYVGVDD